MTTDMFAVEHIEAQKDVVDELVDQHKAQAQAIIISLIGNEQGMRFEDIADVVMERFMLRETNVKDILITLAKKGLIENTWGSGSHKPKDGTVIRMLR